MHTSTRSSIRLASLLALVLACSLVLIALDSDASTLNADGKSGHRLTQVEEAQLSLAEESTAEAPVFLLTQGGRTNAQKILTLYTEARGLPALVNSRIQLARIEVDMPSPNKAVKLSGLNLLQNTLNSPGVVALESGGMIRLVDSNEAQSIPAPIVDRDQLAKLEDKAYVSVIIMLEHIDSRSAQSAIATMLSQRMGRINYVHQRDERSQESLVLTDFADNLQRLVAMFDEVDVAKQMVAGCIALDGVNAQAFAAHAKRLSGVGVSVDESGKFAVFSAPEAQRAHIAALLTSIRDALPEQSASDKE